MLEYETKEATEMLSDAQYKALAIVPVITSTLSIIGSAAIIFMAYQRRLSKQSAWSPYTRLLVRMSTSDIVYSIQLGIGNFLRPEETSNRVWAIGNDATCTFSGFLGQATYSAILYNSMLSFYFLLTARFGMSNETIARRYEPIMHIISIAFPLITATVGAIMGFYAEPTYGMGCWVNDYPRGCSEEDPLQLVGECWSDLIGWIYGGAPWIFCFVSILVNNIVIVLFVHRKTGGTSVPKKMQRIAASTSLHQQGHLQKDKRSKKRNSICEKINENDSSSNSVRMSVLDNDDFVDDIRSQSSTRSSRQEKEQRKRLQLVRSQALLFVMSFLFSMGWAGLLMIMESTTASEDEMELMSKTYWFHLVSAIFGPLQGLYNMLIFMRPKYLLVRQKFSNQSKLWAFHRTLRGDRVIPKANVNPSAVRKSDLQEGHEENYQEENNALQAENNDDKSDCSEFIFPLKDGEMKEVEMKNASESSETYFPISPETNEQRWRGTKSDLSSWSPIQPAYRFTSSLNKSSLEVISEMTEMSFVEPLEDQCEVHNGINDVSFEDFYDTNVDSVAMSKISVNPSIPTFDVGVSRWESDLKNSGGSGSDTKCQVDQLSFQRKSKPCPQFRVESRDESAILPIRIASNHENLIGDIEKRGINISPSNVYRNVNGSSLDAPIRPPTRKLSPPISMRSGIS